MESTKQAVSIDLPWPPTANRYWRNVAGRMVLSREGRRYREAVDGLVWRHLQQEGEQIGFGESDLEVTIDAYPPDRRRRDLDNLLKPILDALQYAELFKDDSQIVSLRIEKCSVIPTGLVRVFLSKAADGVTTWPRRTTQPLRRESRSGASSM